MFVVPTTQEAETWQQQQIHPEEVDPKQGDSRNKIVLHLKELPINMYIGSSYSKSA
jgi:hypothetical protein